MKKEESRQIYEVWILRQDQEHISAIQSDKYDDVFKIWEELSNKWEDAVTKKIPFRLTTPIVSSFDPGLIKEIILRPVLQMTESKNHNPYHQQMMSKGFSSMIGNSTPGLDILDGGYR